MASPPSVTEVKEVSNLKRQLFKAVDKNFYQGNFKIPCLKQVLLQE